MNHKKELLRSLWVRFARDVSGLLEDLGMSTVQEFWVPQWYPFALVSPKGSKVPLYIYIYIYRYRYRYSRM